MHVSESVASYTQTPNHCIYLLNCLRTLNQFSNLSLPVTPLLRQSVSSTHTMHKTHKHMKQTQARVHIESGAVSRKIVCWWCSRVEEADRQIGGKTGIVGLMPTNPQQKQSVISSLSCSFVFTCHYVSCSLNGLWKCNIDLAAVWWW